MELLAAFRIFADHYTFAVCDSQAEPCPASFLELVPSSQPGVLGSFDMGYITDGQSILFGTCAHRNVHWIELFRSETVPDFGSAQRVIALPIDVVSGQVDVATLDLDASVPLTPGGYTAYFLGFSLGREQASDPDKPAEWKERELSDSELAAHTEYEHYQIVFVPGDMTGGEVGVIHGAPDIPGARQDAQQET